MTLVSFTLAMPCVGSWNGRWTGEGTVYAIVRSIRNPSETMFGYYHYDFGDGWCAAVLVETVDANTARKVRKASKGFCGYDWMVDSIIRHGRIYGPDQPMPVEGGQP